MRTYARLAAAATAAATAATLCLTAAGATAAPQDPESPAQRAVEAVNGHAAATHSGPGQAFVATHTITDSDGSTHVRMGRTYKGLEVVGGDLVVHQSRTGAWLGRSQTLRQGLRLSTEPKVQVAKGELVVDAHEGTPRLAWRTVKSGAQDDGTPSRIEVYTDARTGEVIRREQRIMTVDGEGQTLYSGTVPLQVSANGSGYALKDATRGGTYTLDAQNKQDGPLCPVLGMGCVTGLTFTSTDTSFGNGSTSSRESAAADAQYGTNVTWDYFKNVHARNGIFGNGAGSYNRVHYGKSYVNAFWDGEKMTYGDGDGKGFGPLTSLDVAGHEMSHGVTENSANLTYSGESGGLNESTSDIFGTMVEFYAANGNDAGDYLIGEEFDLKNHLGFRRMDDPARDGSSQSCWTTGTKNLDVHYSSGVGNHFFYLLAEGSGAKTIGGVAHNSPTCNGAVITGIGRDAAARIWYRALTVYMTSSTDYRGARTASLNAARDLFGAGSTQYNTVAAAWSAVNVA